MDQKEFEEKLDGYAEKLSSTVSDGVKKVEEAFDKGKANLHEDIAASGEKARFKGSPRMGALLLGVGVVWLLMSLGALHHPVFPILLIIAGIYFLVRNR